MNCIESKHKGGKNTTVRQGFCHTGVSKCPVYKIYVEYGSENNFFNHPPGSD
jgi:hypothetical protein